jgi:hypothetical protein
MSNKVLADSNTTSDNPTLVAQTLSYGKSFLIAWLLGPLTPPPELPKE